MSQTEKRIYLIKGLLGERPEYRNIEIPQDGQEQKRLLRALFNVRPPQRIGEEFLRIQDEYLLGELNEKGIVDYKALKPVKKDIYLWRGDITRLKCGAIVNAANSRLLGCFCPNHGCIDNAIHTFAGIQLRAACAELMAGQGCDEETGKAKITPAFNLPCDYVIHTVGPIVYGRLTDKEKKQLKACYRSCLALAEQSGIKSIAFCCISTGEFKFPADKAAEIAIRTVQKYKEENNSKIEVIFNVFKESDYDLYRKLLGRY